MSIRGTLTRIAYKSGFYQKMPVIVPTGRNSVYVDRFVRSWFGKGKIVVGHGGGGVSLKGERAQLALLGAPDLQAPVAQKRMVLEAFIKKENPATLNHVSREEAEKVFQELFKHTKLSPLAKEAWNKLLETSFRLPEDSSVGYLLVEEAPPKEEAPTIKVEVPVVPTPTLKPIDSSTATGKMAKALTEKYRTSLAEDIKVLQERSKQLGEEIDRLDGEISSWETKISEISEAIKTLAKDIETARENLRKRIEDFEKTLMAQIAQIKSNAQEEREKVEEDKKVAEEVEEASVTDEFERQLAIAGINEGASKKILDLLTAAQQKIGEVRKQKEKAVEKAKEEADQKISGLNTEKNKKGQELTSAEKERDSRITRKSRLIQEKEQLETIISALQKSGLEAFVKALEDLTK